MGSNCDLPINWYGRAAGSWSILNSDLVCPVPSLPLLIATWIRAAEAQIRVWRNRCLAQSGVVCPKTAT